MLTARNEILFAFIYGSFNDNTENSGFRDIDVGVFVTGLNEKKTTGYNLELSDQLSCMLRVTVDIRVLNYAPATFLFHVIKGNVIIDKDEDRRCEFTEWVIRHYLDIKPLITRGIKEAFVDGN